MKQKTADKLRRVKGHGLFCVIVCAIPVGEYHFAIVNGFYPVIWDGNPVGVTAQIFQNLLRTGKRLFRIDDPVFFPCTFQETAAVCRNNKRIYPALYPGTVLLFEFPGQWLYTDQKRIIALDPSPLVKGQNTGGNQAVDVKMINQSLGPGMQNSNDARPAFEFPLRISGKNEQGLLYRRKEKDIGSSLLLAQ